MLFMSATLTHIGACMCVSQCRVYHVLS